MRFNVGMPMHSIPARFPGACPTATLDYQLQQARTFGEVREAQRLRYQVFNVELGEGLPESHADGHDADPFDDVCDHLLVRHGPIGAVVGTYRIQTGHNAAACLGYYSGQEFDLQPFEPQRDSLIELGRACIHPDHRSLTVLGLLWRGIARYARVRRARYLIGCSSLPSQNPCDGAAAYAHIRHRHLSPPHLRTVPLAGWECPLHENDDRPVQLPRLLRAYLGLGAVICGPPAIDRQFKTIDFLTLLDLQALPAAARDRFLA